MDVWVYMIMHATWMATTHTLFPTQAPVITGTREAEMVIFSAQKMGLVALNGWDGYLDGNSIVVYAGSRLEDPQQGAIVVFYNLPSHIDNDQTAWTPTNHGGVRVIAEQNNRLTCRPSMGRYFISISRRGGSWIRSAKLFPVRPRLQLIPPMYLRRVPRCLSIRIHCRLNRALQFLDL